jgi:membrane-associated phospholipid phosphatase
MFDIVYSVIDIFGTMGPAISAIISISILKNKTNYLVYYLFGLLSDNILNILLKGVFKQFRPDLNKYIDPDELKIALHNKRRFIYVDGIPFDIYGMPSGHVQSCFYTMTFLFFTNKSYKQFILFLFISLITAYQRIEKKYHDLFQVVIGAFVGICTGYLFYYLSSRHIMGSLKVKPDDNAFNNLML